MGTVLGRSAYQAFLPWDGTTRSGVSFSVHSTRQIGDGTDSGQLNGKVGEKDLLSTLPLLLRSRNFVGLEFPLLKVRNSVDDDPRNTAPKVYKLGACQRTPHNIKNATHLVKQETHETGSDDGVVDPNVPCSPELLQPAELGKVDIAV